MEVSNSNQNPNIEFIIQRKKAGKIPPIIVANVNHWTPIRDDILKHRVEKVEGNLGGGDLHIKVFTSDHYHKVTALLDERQRSYHTFTLAQDKPINALIKKLPIRTSVVEIKEALIEKRLIRLPSNHHWKNYDYNKQRNLKTQNGFLQCVSRLEQYNYIRTLKPALLFLLNPLDYSFLDVWLDLEMKVDKKERSPEQIRTISLETIEQCFPAEEWIHVYTDGFLTDRIQGTGAGVFSKLFSFYIPVRAYSTHFDGELKAIHIALQKLSLRQS
ncbi:hypothetical protein X975_00014, partial [Stegodyphus mimosarum]